MRQRRHTPALAQADPSLTLKSYLLQEAEAVSREAKLAWLADRPPSQRAISLQHDGLGIIGFPSEEWDEVAAAMSRAAEQAAGYPVVVKLEKVATHVLGW